MRRFVLVHGPWQLLIAASALKQASRSTGRRSRDTLVIFSLHDGHLPSSIREVIDRIAPAVWPWERIVVLDDATHQDVDHPGRSAEAIRALLHEGEPDEVWLDCLWGDAEKLVAEAFPSARLVLYEEGLHSYIPHHDHHFSFARLLHDPRGLYRDLRLRIRERSRPGDLSLALMLPRHLARVTATYLWISSMIPPADYQRRLPRVQLQTSFVKETLAQLSPPVDDLDLEPGHPRAIVLGQNFSSFGDLPRDVELNCYIDMATRLQSRGYDVIWKEHPRVRNPFLLELTEAVPDIHTPRTGARGPSSCSSSAWA